MILSRVRGERCERCHAKKGRNGLRNCSNGCENVLYCSIECQESDYITHVASGECGLIQKRLPSNDNVRFILRFLLALRVIPGKDLPCIIDRVPGYSEPRSFRWLHRVNEDTQFWRFLKRWLAKTLLRWKPQQRVITSLFSSRHQLARIHELPTLIYVPTLCHGHGNWVRLPQKWIMNGI